MLCERCKAELPEKQVAPYGWEWSVLTYELQGRHAAMGAATFNTEAEAEAYRTRILARSPDASVTMTKQPRCLVWN